MYSYIKGELSEIVAEILIFVSERMHLFYMAFLPEMI